MAFTFVYFCLHEFSNITQIMKVMLQYMDVHRLPVTHFTFINNCGLTEGMTCIFFKLHENVIFLQSMIPWGTDKLLPNVPYTLTGESVLSNSQIYPIHRNPWVIC